MTGASGSSDMTGSSGMTGSERGYWWLLHAYPAWYRRARGDEMLDTLLAAAPDDQAWPSLRDAWALILGGLRVRAGLSRRLTTGAGLRQAVSLGIMLWLAGQAGSIMSSPVAAWLGWIPVSYGWAGHGAFWGLLVLAVAVAAWFAPRPVAATVAMAAAFGFQVRNDSLWSLLGAPAILTALALLVAGGERMPRSWLWLLGMEFAGKTLMMLSGWVHEPLYFLSGALNDLSWIVLAAVVLWAVVDARPAIALGVSAALGRAIPFVTSWYNSEFGHVYFWPLAWGAALALVMTLRLRRQAVL